LQQGPTNAKLQQSKRLKTPSDAQKHRLAHNDMGRSSSKKRYQNVKKTKFAGSVSTKSSIIELSSEELSNDDIGSSIPRKRKRPSQISLTEQFKKDKLPTFDGEIKKGK
jgi:hypothetical protein